MSRYDQVGKVATSIRTVNGYTRITYHQTVVVKFSNTEVRLDSGGYRTATTKVRMNQASNQYNLGFQVYQSKHDWYVVTRSANGEYDWDHPIPFVDGMRITRA